MRYSHQHYVPTTDEARHIDNNFSGTTTVEHCTLQRCGGYDHDWTYRGSFQICLDQHDIAGLAIKDGEIDDIISDAFTVIAPRRAPAIGTLSELSVSGSQLQPIQNDAKEFVISGGK